MKKVFAFILVSASLLFFYFTEIRTEALTNHTSDIQTVAKEVPAPASPPSSISSSHILTAPHIMQNPELPRGCEVTSLAMLLQHAGVTVDKMELADKIAKVPFQQDGFSGDLNEGFVGDMYSFDEPGLGVYVKPIIALAEQYLPGRIVNLTGQAPATLYDSIRTGHPVWLITNATFEPLSEDNFITWATVNGEYPATYSEHSVLLTGFDDDYVYINDPLAENQNEKLNKKLFEEAWQQMGEQAITYK